MPSRSEVVLESEREERSGRLSGVLEIGLFAILLIAVAQFCVSVWTSFIAAPFSDYMAFLMHVFRLKDGSEDLLGYLWAPHNGHHPVWTRALTWLDVATGADSRMFVLVTSVVLLVSVGALARYVSSSYGVAAGLLVAVIALSSAAIDCAVPMDGMYIFAVVFGCGALACLSRGIVPVRSGVLKPLDHLQHPGRGPDTEAPLKARTPLLAGCSMAVAAALANGAGLLILPICAATGLRAGETRRVGGIVAAALVLTLLYATDQVSGSGFASDLPHAPGYALAYLGLPFSRANTGVGMAFGLCLLLVTGLAVTGARRRSSAPLDSLAEVMIAFSIITALLASAGRIDPAAPLSPPIRYAIFMTPLHVGIVLLVAPWFRRRRDERPVVAGLSVALVAVSVLGVQFELGVRGAQASAQLRRTIEGYFAGDRTAESLRLFPPTAAPMDAIVDRLRREHRYGLR